MNMSEPLVRINFVSNLFVKQMEFLKAGDVEQGHAHCYDHLTLLASGSMRITALGQTTDFKAPHHIFIKAGVEHRLEALEDNTVAHCIHALREKDGSGDIIDPASVPAGVTPEHQPLLIDNVRTV